MLACLYSFDKARMVAWEMADQLALDLVSQRLATDQLTLPMEDLLENRGRWPAWMGLVKDAAFLYHKNGCFYWAAPCWRRPKSIKT